MTTQERVEELVHKFHNLWDELRDEDEFARYCKGDISNWLRNTLTTLVDEVREEERKRIVEWCEKRDDEMWKKQAKKFGGQWANGYGCALYDVEEMLGYGGIDHLTQ